MENLMFVLWLLGWPIVCSRIGAWEGITSDCERGEIIGAAIVRVLVWLGVAILLYRQ